MIRSTTMGKHKYLGKHVKLREALAFLLFFVWSFSDISAVAAAAAAGFFEDADQANDFLSSSVYHHFDLRHTIPGEPHIDYPIYSEVPKTSFACGGKHEGYYADMETRCQAFRICTHTARGDQGFGFLCPNGTLFSQKNFVCDWYRNVKCEESELYYSKNNANRVGSKQDMMEMVRQMMEYPMKTISKALQSGLGNSKRPSNNAFNSLNEGDDSTLNTRNAPTSELNNNNSSNKNNNINNRLKSNNNKNNNNNNNNNNSNNSNNNNKTNNRNNNNNINSNNKSNNKNNNNNNSNNNNNNINNINNNSRKTPVTLAEIESASKLGSEIVKGSDALAESQNSAQSSTSPVQVGDEFSIDLRTNADSFGSSDDADASEDVYVNSLGELSTDPGVKFDKTQSRIIALGPQDREQKLNFAQTINVALNNLADLSPTTAALAPDYVKRMRSTQEGTITSLVNNINDLQPISSEDAVRSRSHKHGIRLLSRGFSALNDDGKQPYLYNRPKQTPSTVQFTPNALPTDSSLKSSSYDESKSELHKAINTLEASDEEIFEHVSSTPTSTSLETSKVMDSVTKTPPAPTSDDGSYLSPPSLDAPEANDITTFQPILVLNEEELEETDNPTEYETKNSSQLDIEHAELPTPNQNLEINAEKISVNRHATNLLLAGLKLSQLDPYKSVSITYETSPPKKRVITTVIKRGPVSRGRPATFPPVTTTTETISTAIVLQDPTPTTSAIRTSTETVTEISSHQRRLRNFRRFATVQRASLRPEVVAKRTITRNSQRSVRANSRTTTTPATTSTTTTKTTKRSTRNFPTRVNRLRLPRFTTTRSTIVDTTTTKAPTIQAPATTLRNTRHSDRETATYGYNPEAPGSSSSVNSDTAVATWESVRKNLQRFQINRGNSIESRSDSTSEASASRSAAIRAQKTTTTSTTTTTTSPNSRSRKRTSNFKSQQVVPQTLTPTRPTRSRTTKPRTTTTTTTTTTTNSPTLASPDEEQLNKIPPYTIPTASSSSQSYFSPSSLLSSPSTVDLNLLNSILPQPDASSNYVQKTSSSSTNNARLSLAPSATSSDYLSFDKLTQSIVDNSILQNYHSGHLVSSKPVNQQFDSSIAASQIYGNSLQASTNQLSVQPVPPFSYQKVAAKAPSELTPPIRPQHLPQVTPQLPPVVVARAEGQRIEPNSVASIISNLVEKPPSKSSQPKTAYVPLKDFLTSKFGGNNNNNNNNIQTIPTTTQRTQIRYEKPVQVVHQQSIQQTQPQQHHQQQHQQQQLQYQSNSHFNYQQQQQQPQIHHQQQQFSQQSQYQPQLTAAQQQYQQQHTQQQLQNSQPQQQIQHYQQQKQSYTQQQQLRQPQIASTTYLTPQVQQQQHQQDVPFGLAVLNKLQTQQHIPLQNQQQQQLIHKLQAQQQYVPPQQQYVQQHLQTQQHLLQQPSSTQHAFVNHQQQQLQQFPQFPPLRNAQTQQRPQQQQPGNILNYIKRIDSLNVALPALPHGLLPSINAQRRSDDDFDQLDSSAEASSQHSAYDGASSYDVPINSIGRLPNDKTHQLQRLRAGRRF